MNKGLSSVEHKYKNTSNNEVSFCPLPEGDWLQLNSSETVTPGSYVPPSPLCVEGRVKWREEAPQGNWTSYDISLGEYSLMSFNARSQTPERHEVPAMYLLLRITVQLLPYGGPIAPGHCVLWPWLSSTKNTYADLSRLLCQFLWGLQNSKQMWPWSLYHKQAQSNQLESSTNQFVVVNLGSSVC